MSDTKKAAMYCRVASKDDTSILVQEESLRRYAFEMDLNIAAVYSDNGVSGVDLNRSAFNAMMADIKSGKVDCVIAKDLSRIGRNYIQVSEWINNMDDKGLRIICVNDSYDSFNADNTFGLFTDFLRQAYKKIQSAKIKAGIAHKKEREAASSLCDTPL